MTSYKAPRELIDNFLEQRRIAMVGVSRDPSSFSIVLFRELSRRGYDVIPVNPHAVQLEGRSCFARVQDIHPPVEAAILMTPPAATEDVVRDCFHAGVNRVWMYRAGGNGAVSQRAVTYCWEKGIEVIPGECPLMFLPKTGIVHVVHGLIRRISGNYPHRRAA
jgi:uncharacterized protein